MQIPNDQINATLLKLERGIHRLGWDKPSHLAVVQQNRPGTLTAEPLPVRVQNPPGEFLEFVGQRFASGDRWSRDMTDMMVLRYPRFYGLAVVLEVWANEELSPEQQNEMAERGESLADVASSYEARTITIADVYGHTHALLRRRGHKPIVDKVDFIGGRVLEALYQMINAIAVKLPDDACDRETLAKMAVVSVDEAQALWERSRQAASGDV